MSYLFHRFQNSGVLCHGFQHLRFPASGIYICATNYGTVLSCSNPTWALLSFAFFYVRGSPPPMFTFYQNGISDRMVLNYQNCFPMCILMIANSLKTVNLENKCFAQ